MRISAALGESSTKSPNDEPPVGFVRAALPVGLHKCPYAERSGQHSCIGSVLARMPHTADRAAHTRAFQARSAPHSSHTNRAHTSVRVLQNHTAHTGEHTAPHQLRQFNELFCLRCSDPLYFYNWKHNIPPKIVELSFSGRFAAAAACVYRNAERSTSQIVSTESKRMCV